MDTETESALTGIDLEPDRVEQWFDLVDSACRAVFDGDGDGEWSDLRDGLVAAASNTVFDAGMEAWLRYLDDHCGDARKVDILREMCAAGPSSLSNIYRDLTQSGSDTGSSTEDEAFDEVDADDLWARVVEQFGPGWAGWDGSDGGWVQFRDWLYGAANSVDERMYAVAYERLEPLNSMAVSERIDRLAGFGFTISVTAPADANTSPDTDLWARVVEQFGPGWAGWDGSDGGWVQFRDWLYGAANSVDERMYAVAYERLEPLNSMAVSERIEQLAGFGFTINAAAPSEATEQGESTGHTPDATAVTDEEVTEFVGEVFDDAMLELEATLPELATELGISEAELREQLAEISPDEFTEVVTTALFDND